MIDNTKICAIILNYNSCKETTRLFYELSDFNLKKLSIIVIDNSSSVEDRTFLEKKIPKENLIFNKANQGYAEGNKIGISYAIERETDFIILINPDIKCQKEVIVNLLESILENEHIAVIGPRICYRQDPLRIYSDGGCVIPEKGFETFHLNSYRMEDKVKNLGLHEVDYVNGSFFMFKTSVIKELGFMRSDFFMYFEETEWCLRIKKAGYKCMVDSNYKVFHLSSKKGSKYHYFMTRNRLLLAKAQGDFVFKTYKVVIFQIIKDMRSSLFQKKFGFRDFIARTKGVWDSLIH